MLVSQLAWAGPLSVCLSDNETRDTLSPQTMINVQMFQETYKIYSFWANRVPGKESPRRNYLTPEITFAAFKAVPTQYRTVKYLNRSYLRGGNVTLLKAVRKFKNQLKEKYNFILNRDHGKYATVEEIYKAIMARKSEERTKQSLAKNKKDGGDIWLLKRIQANARGLFEKYGFVLKKEKYKRPLKYPDAKSVYEALMNRNPKACTVAALKTNKANNGNYKLLEAYYEFKFEIKKQFNYVLPKANAAIYSDVESVYTALMEINADQLTAQSLNRTEEEGGNRNLLKAYRKFRKELRDVYGFIMPKVKRKRTAKFQNAEDVYKAIMEHAPEVRTQLSLRKSKDDEGDPTLLEAYYVFKEEIEKKYSFTLSKKIESLYPDKERTERALIELPEENRTAKRLDELGLSSLRKACNRFEIQLAKEEKILDYPTRESAIEALGKLSIRDKTASQLRRKLENGGNPNLLKSCYKYNIRLPKEDVMQAYPTYYSAILALNDIPEEDRLPSRLTREPSLGGNLLLYLAALEYEIELPKDKRKYSTRRLTQIILNRLPNRMRTPKMLLLPVAQGGVGDYTFYLRCLEFKITLEKEQSPFFIYPTIEATYNALMARPAGKRTCTQLVMPNDLGGDYALYRAFKRFRVELQNRYNFALELEPLGKYKNRESALKALNALAPEDRIAGKLLRGINEGGDAALYFACRKFEVSLSLSKTKRIYSTPEFAREALMARPLEKRYTTELVKSKEEGGDPTLYNACCEFDIPLPKIKPTKIYSDVETTFKALMEVAEADRIISRLSRPKPKGNLTLVTAYYRFRTELKTLYGFEMPPRLKSPYSTPDAVRAALEKRPKKERTALALNQPYPKGNRALLWAARRFHIKLTRQPLDKYYPDAAAIYIALKQRKEKHNTAKMLNRPVPQGGNHTLLFEYYKHKSQIEEEFGYVIPQEERRGIVPKYPTKEIALQVLNERPIGQRTAKSLLQRKDLGGNWALHSACKRFGIPLDKEELFAAGYDRYRKKILTAQEGVNINVFDYWLALQEATGRECDAIRDVLINNFMPIIFAKAEIGKTATKVDPLKGISMNQTFNYDDLVSGAVLELIVGLDFWHPDITIEEDKDAKPDLEEYLLAKIDRALKLMRKKIYPHKWKEISITAPYGNKNGNNALSKGAFGASKQMILGDKLESKTKAVDTSMMRFEKMVKVLELFRNGDYSFIQSAINTLDEETAMNFNFDEKLLISKKDKINFKKDLYDYLVKRDILKLIPGKYSLWLMGSMGDIGLARKGLSDVNILIVTDAPLHTLKEAMIEIRRAIGSGIVRVGKEGNVTLEIGKEHEYRDMISNAPDLVSLVERYNLGNAEKGIASIEMLSLNASDSKDNRALYRAQFHLTEDLYQMGINGALIAESHEGVAQTTKDAFLNSIAMGNSEYLFFMNDYLSRFFEKQVRAVISAHKFAKPRLKSEKQEKIIQDPIEKKSEGDKDMERGELTSSELMIKKTFNQEVKLNGTVIKMVCNNGSLSMQLTGVLNEGVEFYREFWQKVALDFNGKDIFIDDPELDEEEIDAGMLVALEQQTDHLCEVMKETVQELQFGQLQDQVIRRLKQQESLFAQNTVLDKEVGDPTHKLSVINFDRISMKKRMPVLFINLIEQAI